MVVDRTMFSGLVWMERNLSQPTNTGKLRDCKYSLNLIHLEWILLSFPIPQIRKTVLQERFAVEEFRRTPSIVVRKTEASLHVYFCRKSKDIEKDFTNGGRFCGNLQIERWRIWRSSHSATKRLFLSSQSYKTEGWTTDLYKLANVKGLRYGDQIFVRV